jgi:hypothetical protein
MLHVLLADIAALDDRFHPLLDTITLYRAWTSVHDLCCHSGHAPLSSDAWLTQRIELRGAADGSAPHMGRPMTGWTVGMDPFASPT